MAARGHLEDIYRTAGGSFENISKKQKNCTVDYMMMSSNGNISALLTICVGKSPVNSPHKGEWRGALVFFLSTSD